jgi:hypothetical protein
LRYIRQCSCKSFARAKEMESLPSVDTAGIMWEVVVTITLAYSFTVNCKLGIMIMTDNEHHCVARSTMECNMMTYLHRSLSYTRKGSTLCK